MTEFNELLEKSGIIDFSYRKLRQEDDFNLFTILRNQNEEVGLHSKFIFELLNPLGKHNKQKEFLRLWLETMEISNFPIDKVKVYREYYDIDILITNDLNQAIIIENKIGAGDRPKQLENYYTKVKNLRFKDICIVYLTIEGRMPSTQSVGKIPKETIILTPSYRYEVEKWITKCCSVSAFNPNLRESLNQYQKLISDMAGNSTNHQEWHEYFKLMSEGDNALKAYKIIQNWIHVQWHTEWAFWHDMQRMIEKQGFNALSIQKFNSDLLTNAIHKKRNRNIHYGLTFLFFNINGIDLAIRIRRNDFNTDNLVYLLVVVQEGKFKELKENIEYNNIAQKISDLSEEAANGNWLAKKRTNINFDSFNNEKTLRLVNEEHRMKIIVELWAEISQFIENVKLLLEENK